MSQRKHASPQSDRRSRRPGLLLLVTLLPIAWMAISAVKTDREINQIPPTFLPQSRSRSTISRSSSRSSISAC